MNNTLIARSCAFAIAAVTCGTSPAFVCAADFNIANGDVAALIAAINTANANGESNTIRLAPGGTYSLTAVHNDNPFEGPTGLPVVSSSLTINGNGATLQRSPFAPAFRFFRANHDATLTINDLTMLGGSSGGSGGGAIRSGAFGSGGVAGLTLNNCTFDTCAGSSGGAIFINEGNATLNDSTITWCFADHHGGAIYNFDGTVTLNNSSIDNCLAQFGAAIFNAEGTVNVVDSTIADGTASHGGGAIWATSKATLVGSTISGNVGGGEGGGIRTTAALTAVDTLIINNSAGDGGGVWSNAGQPLSFTNCTIEGNAAVGGSPSGSGNGGGVHHQGASLIIDGSAIIANTATALGGGIYKTASATTATLTDTVIAGNSATKEGGGVFKIGAAMSMTDCTVSENSAQTRGGGIGSAGGTLTLSSTTVSGNTLPSTASSQGGGLYVQNGFVTLNKAVITGNGSPRQGGGIYIVSATLNATDSTISDNVATYDGPAGGTGGGIYATTVATLTLHSSTISGNTAIDTAGLAGSGGGVNNLFLSNVQMTNCTVSGNVSVFGGGIRNSESALFLFYCTVANNVGLPGAGGGIFTTANDGSSVILSHTIVAGSASPAPGASGDVVGSYFDSGWNIVEDGVGVGNFGSKSGDPMLGPLADNGGPTMTHALLAGSIAKDSSPCNTSHDQRGVSRPQGSACDIGAFEVKPLPSTCRGDITGNGSVGVPDLLQLLSCWGPTQSGCESSDLSGNGSVGVPDLLFLLGNWGPCPP